MAIHEEAQLTTTGRYRYRLLDVCHWSRCHIGTASVATGGQAARGTQTVPLPTGVRLARLLLSGLLLCAAAPVVVAHPGMNLGLKIRIDDSAVTYDITLSNDLYCLFTPLDRRDLRLDAVRDVFRFLDPAQEKREREAIEAFFKDANPVTIDGVRVRPILGEMQFTVALQPIFLAPDSSLPPDVRLTLTHPTKSPPKQVSMVWETFAPDQRQMMEDPKAKLEVWAEMDAYEENRLVFFEPDEPEVIWHAPAGPPEQRVGPVFAAVDERKLSLPVASIALVAGWGVVLAGFRFSGRWPAVRRRLWKLTIAPLLAAVLCHNVLVAQVPAPWHGKIEAPGPDEAVEIFRTLHSNIYRAFDYKSESDIYDVLAQSVDGPLLDQVYNEVYQGLIMRDQGGAVARIQSVEILDARMESSGVLPESGAAAFEIHCLWQVRGAVSHWGHVHGRINEYAAVYTVSRRGGNWKITGVEVLEQQRVVPEAGQESEEEEEEEDQDEDEEEEQEVEREEEEEASADEEVEVEGEIDGRAETEDDAAEPRGPGAGEGP